MEEWIRKDVEEALGHLYKTFRSAYDEFRDAWRRTVEGEHKTEGARVLVPFLGAGLAGGPIDGWEVLMRKVATASDTKIGSPRHWESAGLSYPQRLELLLSRCGTGGKKRDVARSFDDMFSQAHPTAIHQRLGTLFPRLVTTNYSSPLDTRESAPPVDLTDPDEAAGREYQLPRCVMHLHGMWDTSAPAERKVKQIFSGIGTTLAEPGPELVLTENQYHRLYRHSLAFQRAVHRLFSGEHLLLFIGSGLTPAELGIHTYLRDLAGRCRGHGEGRVSPAPCQVVDARPTEVDYCGLEASD